MAHVHALHDSGYVDPSDARRHGLVPSAVAFAVSLAAVAVVAGIGRLVTDTGDGSWYASLEQPSWNPPDGWFGPVWTVLYVAMAIAAWLVWRRGGDRAELAPYGVQLVLNLAWTLVFFGLESSTGGVVVIVALWVAIVATIAAFRRVPLAALLMVPYLAWVTYAGALTIAIATMN